MSKPRSRKDNTVTQSTEQTSAAALWTMPLLPALLKPPLPLNRPPPLARMLLCQSLKLRTALQNRPIKVLNTLAPNMAQARLPQELATASQQRALRIAKSLRERKASAGGWLGAGLAARVFTCHPKKAWRSSALEYYENGRGKILIHPETDTHQSNHLV